MLKNVGTKMLCSHNVPKKGLSVSHGVAQLLEDSDRMEQKRMSLKTDGEVALFAIQAGLWKKRSDETLLLTSPVRDSKANGIAEKTVQAISEQVRALKAR